MRRTHVVLSSMLAVAVAGSAAYCWRSPLRLLLLAAAGHSPVCPLKKAVESANHIRQLTLAKDRILRASRLLRKDEERRLELWNTPRGDFWIPAGNRFTLVFNLAEMEQKVYGSGEHFIHPGDVALDCGASDGDFTREALRAGAGVVVAVELAPHNVECLRRNFAGEVAAGRVVVYPKGVWDREDQLMLNEVDDNFAADSVARRPPGSHPSVTVPLTTIDRLVAELHLPRVDFIKMDVEGAEARALTGARETLNRYKPRLAIAAEHNPDDETLIPRHVRNLRPDYRMECGPCVEDKGRIRADVLYFY